MTRRSGTPGKASRKRATGVAASTDTSAGTARPRPSAASASAAGLTARTTTSLAAASSLSVARVSPPTSPASAAARSASRSAKSIASGPPGAAAHPRAIAAAMLPAPAKPTFTAHSLLSAGAALGLVEEALLDEARLLLGRDLDVARREQEGLVGDLLHAAVERVGEAGGEVDQPLRQLPLRRLEVQDHRHRLLEAVRDLLGVVEAVRRHQVDAHFGAVTPHRAQDPRPPPHVLVGEDVVDLVARRPAALADPADRRLPGRLVHVVGPGLGLVGVLGVLRILGEPEVDEGTMPCVAEGHIGAGFAARRPFPLGFLSVERGPEPDYRRPLLDRHAPVLARAHGQPAQTVRGGEL